jgi:hypothetical protein
MIDGDEEHAIALLDQEIAHDFSPGFASIIDAPDAHGAASLRQRGHARLQCGMQDVLTANRLRGGQGILGLI